MFRKCNNLVFFNQLKSYILVEMEFLIITNHPFSGPHILHEVKDENNCLPWGSWGLQGLQSAGKIYNWNVKFA